VSIRLLRRIKFIGAFFIYYQQAAGGVSYYIGCGRRRHSGDKTPHKDHYFICAVEGS
jgi:hypothetical protein